MQRLSFDIPYEITLKNSVDNLKNKITLSITNELNNKFFNETTKTKIKLLIGEIIESTIKSSTTYQQLKIDSGRLRAHLGLKNQDIIDEIIKIWKENIGIVFNPGNGFLRIGEILTRTIIIVAIKADFSDILNITESTYKTEKDELIPWLEWLLKSGDTILVPAFTVKRGQPSDFIGKDGKSYSRTNYGIMIKTKGEGWRIPSDFSGTINKNFVTRAIDGARQEFLDVLMRILHEGFL